MITERPVFLYRMFDYSNTLLYVGISQSFFNRVDQHAADKDWFCDVERITAERFGTRQEALIHEKNAIQREKPMHNKMHNGNNHNLESLAMSSATITDGSLIGKLVTQFEPWHGLEVAGLGFQAAIDQRIGDDYYAVSMLSYLDGGPMYMKLFTKAALASCTIYDTPEALRLYVEKNAAWQSSRVGELIKRVCPSGDLETVSPAALRSRISEQCEIVVDLSLIESVVEKMLSQRLINKRNAPQDIHRFVNPVTA